MYFKSLIVTGQCSLLTWRSSFGSASSARFSIPIITFLISIIIFQVILRNLIVNKLRDTNTCVYARQYNCIVFNVVISVWHQRKVLMCWQHRSRHASTDRSRRLQRLDLNTEVFIRYPLMQLPSI